MELEQQEDVEKAAGVSRTSRVSVRIARSAIRLLLIGCVLWVGWFTASNLSEICSGWKPSPDASVHPLPSVPEHSSVESLASMLGGGWRFAGVSANLRFVGLAPAEARERMNAPPVKLSSESDLSKVGPLLLQMVKAMKIPRRQVKDEGIYALDQPGMMMRVFTRGPDRAERVIAARLALLSGRGWLLLETGPSMEEAPSSQPALSAILSIPSAQRLCERSDKEGRIVAEVVSSGSSWSQLCKHWREQGWIIESPAATDKEAAGCLCRREGEAVQVWSRTPLDRYERLILVLIRVAA